MTHTDAKGQGQRSDGSKDRVEINKWMDRWMDEGDCITSHANAVGKNPSN